MSRVALAVALLIAVTAVVSATTSPAAAAHATGGVPNVVGKRLDRARKALDKADLSMTRFDVNGTRSAKNFKNWYVVSQTPETGSSVDHGAEVRLGLRKKDDRTPGATRADSISTVPETQPQHFTLPGETACVDERTPVDSQAIVWSDRSQYIGRRLCIEGYPDSSVPFQADRGYQFRFVGAATYWFERPGRLALDPKWFSLTSAGGVPRLRARGTVTSVDGGAGIHINLVLDGDPERVG